MSSSGDEPETETAELKKVEHLLKNPPFSPIFLMLINQTSRMHECVNECVLAHRIYSIFQPLLKFLSFKSRALITFSSISTHVAVDPGDHYKMAFMCTSLTEKNETSFPSQPKHFKSQSSSHQASVLIIRDD